MPHQETVQTVETQESANGAENAVSETSATAAADKPLHELPLREYMKARKDPAKSNAPESATGTQETEEQKAAKEAAEKEEHKSKGGGFQRKIDKLTKRASQLEEALDAEKLARQTAESRLAGKPAATEAAKPSAGEPKGLRAKPSSTRTVNGKEVTGTWPDGTPYKTYEEFTEDLADWRFEKRTLEADAEKTKSSQETAEKAIFQAHHTRVEEFRKANTDYDEVMEDMDGESLSFPAGMTIIRRKDSAAILYHLAKNPEVREKLNALADPYEVASEVGVIAASISSASSKNNAQQPPKKTAPPPPAPIEPVSGGSARSAKPMHELSLKEYMQRRGMKR